MKYSISGYHYKPLTKIEYTTIFLICIWSYLLFACIYRIIYSLSPETSRLPMRAMSNLNCYDGAAT